MKDQGWAWILSHIATILYWMGVVDRLFPQCLDYMYYVSFISLNLLVCLVIKGAILEFFFLHKVKKFKPNLLWTLSWNIFLNHSILNCWFGYILSRLCQNFSWKNSYLLLSKVLHIFVDLNLSLSQIYYLGSSNILTW